MEFPSTTLPIFLAARLIFPRLARTTSSGLKLSAVLSHRSMAPKRSAPSLTSSLAGAKEARESSFTQRPATSLHAWAVFHSGDLLQTRPTPLKVRIWIWGISLKETIIPLLPLLWPRRAVLTTKELCNSHFVSTTSNLGVSRQMEEARSI